MTRTFEFRKYRITVSNRSKQPWTHFKLHRNHWRSSWSRHLVWGILSVYIDTPDLSEEQVCPHCFGEVQHLGEDGIDFCDNGCGIIEGDASKYLTIREIERLS